MDPSLLLLISNVFHIVQDKLRRKNIFTQNAVDLKFSNFNQLQFNPSVATYPCQHHFLALILISNSIQMAKGKLTRQTKFTLVVIILRSRDSKLKVI